jgi:DNA excision repair protein ERCC-2
VHRALGAVNTWMLGKRRSGPTADAPWSEDERPEALLPLLERFVGAAEAWLVKDIKTDFREPLLDLYFCAGNFLKVADHYSDSYATCYTPDRGDFRVKLFCVDPSQPMSGALSRCRSAVLFSATLAPVAYFKEILGCRRNASVLRLASPFPRENLGLYVLGGISTLYRHRGATGRRLARALSTLVIEKTGNYLFFFPSYAYLCMIRDAFGAACPDVDMLTQRPAMPESDRERFLSRFSVDNTKTLVGFAVLGGVFGEGIDLVGDRLTGAVIIGVGLPGLSPERDRIRNHFALLNEKGFEYAYQYPGLNRVLQAAGRVIRSASDRGIVVLIDTRYFSHRYRLLFPPWWRPRFVRHEFEIKAHLTRFWSRPGNADRPPEAVAGNFTNSDS